jgi:uncharacterized protein YbjT (DUF2867 family)
MILVTGASGNIGGAVVAALLDRGRPVRVLSRSGSADGLPEGVDVARGDLDDPASVGAAAGDAEAAFLLPGFKDMPGVLAALREAGVGHVVGLSGSSAAGGDTDNAVSRYMIESEQAVRDSGLPWTILRPSAFMTNLLRWLPQLEAGDVVRLPWEHIRTALLDPRDIGEVAATALGSPDHHGAVHRLTGGEALTPAEQVAILAEGIGRDLRFEGQSDEEARAEMSEAMPAPYVDAFFSFYSDGTLDESVVLPTVQDVLGRPPGTLPEWVRDHADRFPRA